MPFVEKWSQLQKKYMVQIQKSDLLTDDIKKDVFFWYPLLKQIEAREGIGEGLPFIPQEIIVTNKTEAIDDKTQTLMISIANVESWRRQYLEESCES